MGEERELSIDGKSVFFAVDISGQAVSVPFDYVGGGPPDQWVLTARVGSAANPEWSGILMELGSDWTTSIADFSDEKLRSLFATRGPRP